MSIHTEETEIRLQCPVLNVEDELTTKTTKQTSDNTSAVIEEGMPDFDIVTASRIMVMNASTTCATRIKN